MKRQTKQKIATQVKTKTAMRQDLWAVFVRAPVCKNRWWQFWKPMTIRVGLQVLTVQAFAELLQRGIPGLAASEALRVAGELVESGLASEMGIATVMGGKRQAVEEHRRRLSAESPN